MTQRSTPPAPSEIPAVDGGHDASIARLRAEAAEALEPLRRARILHEVAELEEQLGDLVAASRDHLAAFQTDESFLEPLEGLLRLSERRRALANPSKLLEALVRAARTDDERARALVLRAADLADSHDDWEGARGALLEATELEAAPAERAAAWLALEAVAAKLGDAELRERALTARAEFSRVPNWRSALWLDVARLRAAQSDFSAAVTACAHAMEGDAASAFLAAGELARLAGHERESGDGHAAALAEVQALQEQVQRLGELGSEAEAALPSWARAPGVALDLASQWVLALQRAGEHERALTALDQTIERARREQDDAALAALARLRLRLADDAVGTALAAELSRRPELGAVAASFALRAYLSSSEPEVRESARATLDQLEPSGLLARALRRKAVSGEAELLLAELEADGEQAESDAGKARAWVTAAFVAAFRLGDAARGWKLLERAPLPPEQSVPLRRAFALAQGEANLALELLAQRMQHAELGDDARFDGWLELLRDALARVDEPATRQALQALQAQERGRELSLWLEALLPDPPQTDDDGRQLALARREAALDALGQEQDGGVLPMLRALEQLRQGEHDKALAAIDAWLEREPSDLFAASLSVALQPPERRAQRAHSLSAAVDEPRVAAQWQLQGALAAWYAAEREAAVDGLEQAGASLEGLGAASAAEDARAMRRWIELAVAPSAGGARSEAAAGAEGGARGLGGLRWLATALHEHGLGNESERGEARRQVEDALAALHGGDDGPAKQAAALLEVALRPAECGWGDAAQDIALERLEGLGATSARLVAAERARWAHQQAEAHGNDDEQTVLRAARRWHEAGGGLPAALLWRTAARAERARALGEAAITEAALAERAAVLAAARDTDDEALRDALRVEAALVLAPRVSSAQLPLLRSQSRAARLANLELAPPGSDPRRRALALSEVGDAVGEGVELDACVLAGWSGLAANQAEFALELFRFVTEAREEDLAAWEGQRSAAELLGEREAHALAAEALGTRVHDDERSAAFWEEAADAWLAIGGAHEVRGEHALQRSFARAPQRLSAFDKLFRRLRERKEHAAVLELTAARLAVLDASRPGAQREEAAKLHWERARALRELGQVDQAMGELTTVRTLDPQHVGALALTGEVYIREQRFDAAADTLAELARLEAAPPRSRATAAVTAVDLYENKLQRPDRALAVLESLHAAGLTTLPIRERMARTAVRADAHLKAAEVLEQLMQERETSTARAEAARAALRLHRDHLKAPRGAERAVEKLLAEIPDDGEAIDLVLLTEFAPALRQRLFERSKDALLERQRHRDQFQIGEGVDDFHRLAQLGQRLHDPVLVQSALGIAACLGDAQAAESLRPHLARKPRAPRVALPAAGWLQLRATGDSGPLTELFALLGPTLTEALGPNLSALQVGRKERVDPREGLSLRSDVSAWSGAFGLPELDLYLGGRDPEAILGVAESRPAMVVGTQVASPLTALGRARVARELYAMSVGTNVLIRRDETVVASIVTAACRLVKVPHPAPEYAVLAEVERALSKALPRKIKAQLPDLCQRVVREQPDALPWIAAARRTQARVALLASGDLSAAMQDLSTDPSGDAAMRTDLIHFALSAEFSELRNVLGLEAAGREQ